MTTALRVIYRNVLVETILLGAVLIQIASGLKLIVSGQRPANYFDKVHIWTGLYLAIFLIIHVGAVFSGRLFLNLDTNLYFGAAGLNSFPANLFFVPYYGAAIISFFGHVASIHHKKMKRVILGVNPQQQATMILIAGFFITVLIFYGLTNGFTGLQVPEPYKILTGS